MAEMTEQMNDAAAVENSATQTSTDVSSPDGAAGGTGESSGTGAAGSETPDAWKASLPEAWRDKVDGVKSMDEALEAMKRGMNYHPAVNADDLVTTWGEGVEFDADANKQFRELGVKIGLTKEQAQALVDFEVRSQQEMQARATEADIQALRKSWGTEFESKSSKAMETMLRVDKMMGNRLSAALGNEGIKGSPVLMEAFAAIGNMISEDTLAGGSSAAGAVKTETAEEMYRGKFH